MEKLIEFRKELHQHPELSGREKETAQRVIDYITPFRPTRIIQNIGGHGLAAIFQLGDEGMRIAIRCELDALPIAENNTFDHQSKNDGVSHKCGHDGHITMVVGLLSWLQSKPFDKGTVILLFQPAEENGQGAKAMLTDPKFQAIRPDYLFALHNLPKLRMHQVFIYPQQFSPTVQSVVIKLTGKKTHAAEPQEGQNPAYAIATILDQSKKMERTNPNDQNFVLLTPVYVHIGQPDYGIAAGYGEVHFTIRAWQKAQMKATIDNLKTLIQEQCAAHQLSVHYEWFDYFPTVTNDDFCNKMIEKAAQRKGIQYEIPTVGCKFGEDFGWFSEAYPSAMFGLGAGIHTPALHNDDYDFPDELLETGIRMFQGIIETLLES